MNRTTVEKFIHQNFAGIAQDYPWADEPAYTVFRHADNRKWFALIMNVPRRLLGLGDAENTAHPSSPDHPENLDIINLKADPDLIETLLREPGVLPAYHMSKAHWISLLLDGSASPDLVAQQIDMSYNLTAKRSRHSTTPDTVDNFA